jgi:small subunit ribosomal protein S19e
MTTSAPRLGGTTVKDVPAQQFIFALASHLKKSGKLELPEWHDIVKTSIAKELSPLSADWYYVRAASLLRRVYLRGGIGVGAFSKVYGCSNRLRHSRPCFSRGARGLVRHILKQLETEEFIAKKESEKGRFVTSKGRKELDTLAGQLLSTKTA